MLENIKGWTFCENMLKYTFVNVYVHCYLEEVYKRMSEKLKLNARRYFYVFIQKRDF